MIVVLASVPCANAGEKQSTPSGSSARHARRGHRGTHRERAHHDRIVKALTFTGSIP
jgi:hypothetical protein